MCDIEERDMRRGEGPLHASIEIDTHTDENKIQWPNHSIETEATNSRRQSRDLPSLFETEVVAIYQ